MNNFLKRLLTRAFTSPSTIKDESGALWALSLLIGAGIASLFFYALQAPLTFFSTFTAGVMLASAALVVGGLIGFLFGIPRTLQNGQPTANHNLDHAGDNLPEVAYQANTNLEQISDWLTKILVGVGLTQLTNFWPGLKTAATFIQPGLGGGMAAPSMALAILVYFPVCGFLFGYLWTRLFLAGAFRKADLVTIIRRAEEKAIVAVAQTVEPAGSAAARTTAPEGTLEANKQREKQRGLWVDDNPSNNAALKQSYEKLLDITFDLSLSTEDALEKVQSTQPPYRVIISDMSRPPDPYAAYTLLDGLQAIGVTIPVLIYAALGGNSINRAEAQRHKAFGITNSPQELWRLLQQVLQPNPLEK